MKHTNTLSVQFGNFGAGSSECMNEEFETLIQKALQILQHG